MRTAERVIIVTPGGSVFTEPLVRAFTKAGLECAVFDHRQGLVFTSPVIRRAVHAFPSLKFLKRWRIERTNRSLLDLVRAYRPRFLLGQKAESITPETIREIRSLGVVTANFYNDFINQWDGIRRIAPAFDFFFTPDHHVLRCLEREGVRTGRYLPFAVEPQANPFLRRQNRYTIGFVGTYNPAIYHNRESFLEAVRGFDLHIWGNNGWARSRLSDRFHGRAMGTQRFEIYRSSNIIVDVNFNEWPCEAMSMRPFEVGSGGACLFSDTIRADLLRAFEPGKEFVAFESADDLKEKAGFYVRHGAECSAIARALYNNVIANHTYDVRIQQILGLMRG